MMKTDTETPLLTISDVTFSYPGQSLFTDFSITVNQGDVIGVIGPNGAGKSTLLQIMNGLLKYDSGEIFLKDQNLGSLSRREIAREIAFVPQYTVVAHAFTVMEIVLMGRFPYKSMLALDSNKDIKIVEKMLKVTGAAEFANRQFSTLSGGEKQRVILASALTQEPSLLLLDEPTSALDIYYQLHIFNTLANLNRDSGIAIVMAVHDLNLAGKFCNRIWLLDGPGKFLDGSPTDILKPEILEPVFHVKMTQAATEDGKQWLIPVYDGKSS